MKTRQLGDSDLQITPLGIGTWAIGGSGWEFAWGSQDDEQSITAIHEGLDSGINWIDTAAAYGLGHAEEIVATALHGIARRPYVFTKCSLVWNDEGRIGHSLKADSVRKECEASLRRLQVEAIDLYQVHWPVPDEDIEEGWATLAALQQEGKVRHIGVSNFDVAQMQRAQSIAPITSLQPPYSLIHREAEEELLPFTQRENVGVIAYSPMASGLLTGAMTAERVARLPEDDWRKHHPDFNEPQFSQNMRLVNLLRSIAESHGRTTAEAALAWVLHNPAVTGAIVGVRRPDHVRGVIGAAEFQFSRDELAKIDELLAHQPI